MKRIRNEKKSVKSYKQRLKWLLLFVFLTITAYSAFAQDFRGSAYDKRIFGIEAAAVFSGSGDAWGFGYQLSHLKTIGKRFYLKQNLSSWIVNGGSWIEGGFENQTCIDVSAEIGISPFKMNKRFLNITGGVCGAYFINTSPNGGGGHYIGNSYMSYYNQGFEQGFDAGITFGLNYHSQISEKLYLISGATFRTHYKYGTAISMISIGLGFDAKQLFK